MPSYSINRDLNRVEIYFEQRPSDETIRRLKEYRWWWDPNRLCWHNRDWDSSRAFAKELCGGSAPVLIKPISQSSSTHSMTSQQSKINVHPSGKCGSFATWSFFPETGHLLIGGSGSIDGYSFEKISDSPWHAFRNQIIQVLIGGDITEIGMRAFSRLENLTRVDILSNIEIIGPRAFSKCKKLSLFSMPRTNLYSIASKAFEDCTALKEITIDGLTFLADDAFKGWTSEQIIWEESFDFTSHSFSVKRIFPNLTTGLRRVYFEDFIALDNTGWCERNGHDIETVRAIISIVSRNGNIVDHSIIAGYCKDCQRYFINTWKFNELKQEGILLCQITEIERAQKQNGFGFYATLSPQSLLKQSGYSVSKTDDLSSEQRHTVLIYLVESGICSKERIKNHLTWLIESREGQIELQDAISKWSEDREFISNYSKGDCRTVMVRSILTKK